jgi:hypothetical protein
MVCVTRKSTGGDEVLRNYPSTHPGAENYDCTIWEAASATAAAPMFFSSVKLKTGDKFVDGGLRRNNPVREAMAELQREKSFKNREVGCLVSLGTGLHALKEVPSNLALFLKEAVHMMTDAEGIAEEFASSATGNTLADSNRYFRFNVPQGMEDLQLDECKEVTKMRALTLEYLKKVGNGNLVMQCAKVLANPDQIGLTEYRGLNLQNPGSE